MAAMIGAEKSGTSSRIKNGEETEDALEWGEYFERVGSR
jgi:hypothetical protein